MEIVIDSEIRMKIEISRILGCPSYTKSMLGGDFKGVDYGRKSVFGFPAGLEIGQSEYHDVRPDGIEIFVVTSITGNDSKGRTFALVMRAATMNYCSCTLFFERTRR